MQQVCYIQSLCYLKHFVAYGFVCGMCCGEICIVNFYYCLSQSALWKKRIAKGVDTPANIYFIGELITNKPHYLTCDLYETTIELFENFDEQTRSDKLSQSKQLICDTLTRQELEYLKISESLFAPSKFFYIFIELYFVVVDCLRFVLCGYSIKREETEK